jgi:hypothetical protein
MLLQAERNVLLIPTLLVTLFLAAGATLFGGSGAFETASTMALVALVVIAQASLVRGFAAWLRHGDDALRDFSTIQLAALHLGPLLFGAGLFAVVLGGAMSGSVLGLLCAPTLPSYVHLLMARHRALVSAALPANHRAILLAAALAFVFFAFEWAVTGPLPFDRARWDASDYYDELHRRHRMADWLLFTRELDGRSRADVVALLGEPRETDYFSDWSMVYKLGDERGSMSIDSEWLVVRLDGADQVREARIVRD